MQIELNELAQLIGGKSSPEFTLPKAPRIIVLDRGFCFAGNAEVKGGEVTITEAVNIRRWGTSKGLGELAAEGPKSETKLDPTGTVRAPISSLVFSLEITCQSWKF